MMDSETVKSMGRFWKLIFVFTVEEIIFFKSIQHYQYVTSFFNREGNNVKSWLYSRQKEVIDGRVLQQVMGRKM